MFLGVEKKLERAAYCLNNLKALADEAGGFAYIKRDKQQAMRANLDCFFFEVISAKDFFLQGINDNYAKLPKDEGTKIDLLKRYLESKKHSHALEVVKSIEKKLSDKNSWLWRLNNYRNSAMHRDLLSIGYVASTSLANVEAYLFKDPEDPAQGNADVEVIIYCEESLKRMREFLERLYSELNV